MKKQTATPLPWLVSAALKKTTQHKQADCMALADAAPKKGKARLQACTTARDGAEAVAGCRPKATCAKARVTGRHACVKGPPITYMAYNQTTQSSKQVKATFAAGQSALVSALLRDTHTGAWVQTTGRGTVNMHSSRARAAGATARVCTLPVRRAVASTVLASHSPHACRGTSTTDQVQSVKECDDCRGRQQTGATA